MATATQNKARVSKAQQAEASQTAIVAATATIAVVSDLLLDVTNKTVDMGKSEEALKLAVIAAGGDKAEVQKAFYIGRYISVLDYTTEQALKALGKTNNPDKLADKGDDYRTPNEQKAYDAMRGMWSTKLKNWGLKSDHANAGNKNNGKGDGDKNLMSTEKLKAPKAAKVETSIELAAYLKAEASRLYDFFLLNKEHSAVKAARGSRLMGITADYLAAIEEEVAASEA